MEYENIEEEYNALTEMQKRFIDYYIETANATEYWISSTGKRHKKLDIREKILIE